MDKYIILCTEEQTRKAYELGAPLNFDYHIDDFQNAIKISNKLYAEVPTVEEMIGWLEDMGIIIIFMPTVKYDEPDYRWVAHVWRFQDDNFQDEIVWIDSENLSNLSRKKVTLAAIDAALEYLEKANEE